MTVESCLRQAASYNYAGLLAGVNCYYGNNIDPRVIATYPLNRCLTACSGGSGTAGGPPESCGLGYSPGNFGFTTFYGRRGLPAARIFTSTTTIAPSAPTQAPGYQNIYTLYGCIAHDAKNPILPLIGSFGTGQLESVFNNGMTSGRLFLGLQLGNFYSGSTLKVDTLISLPDSNCNLTCDGQNICGGQSAMTLYEYSGLLK